MSTNCMDEESKESRESQEWDFMCPQFCDLMAQETSDQLIQIDNFFEVDHEVDDQKTINEDNALRKPIDCELRFDLMTNELNEELKYSTPPQNKENLEDDDYDNEVFYSTKKSLTIEKKAYNGYHLRTTPMRTLQYNGTTPLRETRISSKKKSKKSKLGVEATQDETVFKMDPLVEALPTEVEVVLDALNEIKNNISIENEVNFENENQFKDNNDIESEEQNQKFENENIENALESDVPLTGRESYVVESRVQKTVKLVSPRKSDKSSNLAKKRFANRNRRKGTPIRSSSSNRKVSNESIISRLYSTKTSANKYKSMAELLREFESQPRDYDRSRSVERTGSGLRSRSSSVSSLTRPKSPKLSAVLRHRPTPRQTEDLIASEIKKYSFKANPIRKKLFDAKFASGIPRVKSSKAPTKALEINFLTQLRANKHLTDSDQRPADNQKFQFKANPMPAFKSHHILQTKSEKKVKAFAFKPFSFDDRIKDLVVKKRSHSVDTQQHIDRDLTRKSFRF